MAWLGQLARYPRTRQWHFGSVASLSDRYSQTTVPVALSCVALVVLAARWVPVVLLLRLLCALPCRLQVKHCTGEYCIYRPWHGAPDAASSLVWGAATLWWWLHADSLLPDTNECNTSTA